jgi:hypothetical protein
MFEITWTIASSQTSQICKTLSPLQQFCLLRRLFTNQNIDVHKVDSTFDYCIIVLTSCDDKQIKDKN